MIHNYFDDPTKLFSDLYLVTFLTLRLYKGSFWAQTKFSSQITFEIKKGEAWLLSLKKLGRGELVTAGTL